TRPTIRSSAPASSARSSVARRRPAVAGTGRRASGPTCSSTAGGAPGRRWVRATRPGPPASVLRGRRPPGGPPRPRAALRAFDAKLPGFAGADGQLIGVETRTSSPVRVVRDPETLESREVAGLHPCGEGAGYAGGIVSAALDGRRVAAAIVARLG